MSSLENALSGFYSAAGASPRARLVSPKRMPLNMLPCLSMVKKLIASMSMCSVRLLMCLTRGNAIRMLADQFLTAAKSLPQKMCGSLESINQKLCDTPRPVTPFQNSAGNGLLNKLAAAGKVSLLARPLLFKHTSPAMRSNPFNNARTPSRS